ncbi:protoporphyrinogen oxidase HemJ [Legionella sp. PATHC032]|uniref:protoporphyrinogen oxidase HemJ n=1 Tax=Legionella sp. PATHC032 TaxID=2992039 RepID=UPI001B0D8F4E|nr:protoporphyrinogen oxidase HemJ [Legionella sp. PATHC032]MCW8421419.1 protoporphyrinogen oxidase HemJ [Legionella sp. PATHC032]HAZ7574527.1 protoporphyrinogen oxidase HemJ [Legionella pneumophila]HBA1633998.1 protoporphyrinogen oxidase HemJ [Legionella pneumophila]
MLFIKAFHIIALVAWFAGLFYLPRLYVYHAESQDKISVDRFKIMERRLYYGITWPAALATSLLGLWLLTYNLSYYLKAGWMHMKLALVLLLWIYHLICGHYLKAFALGNNTKSSRFYRFFNEMPTLLLVGIVLLVVVKPF